MKIFFFAFIFLLSFSKSHAANDSLTVYIFFSEICPICQNQTYSIRELYKEFHGKSVGFVGVFPNYKHSTEKSIEKFGKKYKLNFPLMKDENHELTNKFDAKVTPQVFVCQSENEKLQYSGKIDNSFESIGRRRNVITEFYLRDALLELIQGKTVTLSVTQPVGCFIVK